MKPLFSVLFFVFFALTALAQDSLSSVLFQRTFGHSPREYVSRQYFQKDVDGGYILTLGNSVVGDRYYNDIWIAKLDSLFNIKWQRTISTGDATNDPGSIIPAIGGGYLFTCEIYGHGGDFQDVDSSIGYWLIRMDTVGNILWKKQFRGPCSDPHILSNGQDGYFIGSTSYDTSFGLHWSGTGKMEEDILIQKIDTAGNLIWGHCFGGVNLEAFSSFDLTKDGGVISIGVTTGDDGDVHGFLGMYDMWVIKVSPAGELQWQKCVGTAMWDMAFGIRALADGSFLATGGVNSRQDGYVARISKTGELLSEFTVGGEGEDIFHDALQLRDGSIIAVGSTKSAERAIPGYKKDTDVWVCRFDKNGNTIAERCYGGQYDEIGFTITPLKNGHFLIYGLTTSTTGDVQGKTNSDIDAWVFEIAASGGAPPVSIGSPLLNRGRRLVDPEFPRQLIFVYPNPFRGRVMVDGLLPFKSYEVNIYNALGQQILTHAISNASRGSFDVAAKGKLLFLAIRDLKSKRLIGTVKLISE